MKWVVWDTRTRGWKMNTAGRDNRPGLYLRDRLAAMPRWLKFSGRLMVALLLPAGAVLAVVWMNWQTPRQQPEKDTPAGELIHGATIGQVFTADEAGVYRIDVSLATYGRQNTGPVVFHVRSWPVIAKDWAVLQVDAAQLQDNAWRSFEFAPLPNRPGDKIYFYMEAPTASHGNAITLWGTRRDVYPGGQAIAPWPLASPVKDLAFRVYYQASPAAALHSVYERLAAGRPGPLGSAVFYALLFLVYAVLLFGLGRHLFGARPEA